MKFSFQTLNLHIVSPSAQHTEVTWTITYERACCSHCRASQAARALLSSLAALSQWYGALRTLPPAMQPGKDSTLCSAGPMIIACWANLASGANECATQVNRIVVNQCVWDREPW